jgi:hypothetical protein
MNSIVKNILAIIAGLIIGSVVNMGIIMISGSVIQPPDGADVTTMDGLKASIHLFEPKHFLFPFLAHAIGTLFGSLVSALIAVNNKMIFAIIIGVFFLMGGIINSFLLPAPKWFIFMDLMLAYIPMAWIGGKIVLKNK